MFKCKLRFTKFLEIEYENTVNRLDIFSFDGADD